MAIVLSLSLSLRPSSGDGGITNQAVAVALEQASENTATSILCLASSQLIFRRLQCEDPRGGRASFVWAKSIGQSHHGDILISFNKGDMHGD